MSSPLEQASRLGCGSGPLVSWIPRRVKLFGAPAIHTVTQRSFRHGSMVSQAFHCIIADADISTRTFEAGFLTLSVLPVARYVYPHFEQAREVVAAAMADYIRKGGLEYASGLVRKRFEHHRQFGLSDEDIARGELGNTFAVLGSSTPCALWVVYHIFSDDQVLADIRKEVSALVHETADGEHSIDLAATRTHCPALLSTFQETMRYRTVSPGARVLLEDVLLDGRIKLKKGSMLMLPVAVQHTNESAWGNDANTFDHLRFTSRPNHRKPTRTAFRAFGGGHVLCPGRHFASNEIMAFAALLVLQFDIVPTSGKWVEPTWNNSPAAVGFPVPDEDIEVEFRPRYPDRKWKVIFSGADEPIGIVSEDITNQTSQAVVEFYKELGKNEEGFVEEPHHLDHSEVPMQPPSRGNFLGWSEGARDCPRKRFSH